MQTFKKLFSIYLYIINSFPPCKSTQRTVKFKKKVVDLLLIITDQLRSYRVSVKFLNQFYMKSFLIMLNGLLFLSSMVSIQKNRRYQIFSASLMLSQNSSVRDKRWIWYTLNSRRHSIGSITIDYWLIWTYDNIFKLLLSVSLQSYSFRSIPLF